MKILKSYIPLSANSTATNNRVPKFNLSLEFCKNVYVFENFKNVYVFENCKNVYVFENFKI